MMKKYYIFAVFLLAAVFYGTPAKAYNFGVRFILQAENFKFCSKVHFAGCF